jgi:hypothetical protein
VLKSSGIRQGLFALIVVLEFCLAPPLSGGNAEPPGTPTAALLETQGPPASDDEPEEPDFAFITGGPYTQKKNSIQFIFPSAWSSRRTNLGGSILQHAEYSGLLRVEWGLTDRWELDAIFSAEGERHRLGQQQLSSTFALADSVVGIRYRLLQESSAPITLAMGPQLIIPTGSFAGGTSNSSVGYAWDLAAAKDWGGPVFVYASANYAYFPSLRPELAGALRGFHRHNAFGAMALVFRPLEIDRGPNHHDLHLFFECGLGREEGLELDAPVQKSATTLSLFAPGIRYGFLTRKMRLFEIGVSFPIGLNQATPRGGVIVQIQFEHIFGFREK